MPATNGAIAAEVDSPCATPVTTSEQTDGLDHRQTEGCNGYRAVLGAEPVGVVDEEEGCRRQPRRASAVVAGLIGYQQQLFREAGDQDQKRRRGRQPRDVGQPKFTEGRKATSERFPERQD